MIMRTSPSSLDVCCNSVNNGNDLITDYHIMICTHCPTDAKKTPIRNNT